MLIGCYILCFLMLYFERDNTARTFGFQAICFFKLSIRFYIKILYTVSCAYCFIEPAWRNMGEASIILWGQIRVFKLVCIFWWMRVFVNISAELICLFNHVFRLDLLWENARRFNFYSLNRVLLLVCKFNNPLTDI